MKGLLPRTIGLLFCLVLFLPVVGWADPVAKIDLSADPVSIPADGNHSVSITATLTDRNGLPPSATNVTFTTTRGVFKNGLKTYTETGAGASGIVIVSLMALAGDAGIAEVTCEADGVKQYIAVIFEAAATMTLVANPTSIPADGASSSRITATLTGSNQSPVPSGTPVTFTTDKGKFQNGQQTITEVTLYSTGSTSEVSVSLISDTSPGVAHVVCSSNGITQQVNVSMGYLPTATITLSADPLMIPADGKSSSLITATLLDSSGAPVPVGTEAIFTTNHGTFSNRQQTITLSTTSSNGIIKVSLIAGTENSIAEVVCTSNGVSQKIVIGIGSSIGGITLTATPLKIPADGVSSSLIAARIVDQNNNLIPAGTMVRFTTNLGKFANGQKTIEIVTTVGYIAAPSNAVASLMADTVPGKALVTCSSGGVTQAITVEMGEKPAATIQLAANPTKIPADGNSSAVITATLTDSGGNPVANGTAVTFTTTLGIFRNNSQSITELISNNAGTVSVSLMSGTTNGIATIVCSANGVTQQISIQIGELPVSSIELSANPKILFADGHSTSTITAILKDSLGRSVGKGTSVTFSATTRLGRFVNGDFNITVSTQDDSGSISVSLIAGDTSGVEKIVCTSSGVSQSVDVKIILLQYEFEPNNEMGEANWITFGDAFSAQLASPYDVDWYVFDITQVGKIQINFITTAIPKGAGCEGGTSTVGTYRVDVRNADNNVIMSYQNVDCNLDNGYWEAGIGSPGRYYIVVYCPRLPDNSHYLSTTYYISLFKETNNLCTPNIRANGKDGLLTATTSQPVTIQVDMDAGKQRGLIGDWWLVLDSPWGYYSLTNAGWVPGIVALAQYPLVDFNPITILYNYLSAGDYIFYFAVDVKPNGVLETPFYYDYVKVHIGW